jgi:hypothetical protein
MTVPDDNLQNMILLESDSRAGGPHSGNSWVTDDPVQVRSLPSSELNVASSQTVDRPGSGASIFILSDDGIGHGESGIS